MIDVGQGGWGEVDGGVDLRLGVGADEPGVLIALWSPDVLKIPQRHFAV